MAIFIFPVQGSQHKVIDARLIGLFASLIKQADIILIYFNKALYLAETII